MKKKTNNNFSRKYAVQILYAWEISNNNINDIIKYCLYKKKKKNINYLKLLISGIILNSKEIDKILLKYFNNKIGYIEKIILRIALFELSKFKNIPYKVTINESIKLTKIFCGKNTYKFINFILDKIIKNILKNL